MTANIDQVLDDLEEVYDGEGFLALYHVGWTMTGLLPRTDPEFDRRCRETYDAFRALHPELVLVWVRWPIRMEAATIAAADTAIDLDLDPDSPGDTPLLALVPPSDVPTV